MPLSATSKRPWRGFTRAGKCAPLVAEQLALDERGRKRRAVHADERALASRAPLVQGAREQLLPRPRVAGQKDRRVGRVRPP